MSKYIYVLKIADFRSQITAVCQCSVRLKTLIPVNEDQIHYLQTVFQIEDQDMDSNLPKIRNNAKWSENNDI
jgi:hypothetical protein